MAPARVRALPVVRAAQEPARVQAAARSRARGPGGRRAQWLRTAPWPRTAPRPPARSVGEAPRDAGCARATARGRLWRPAGPQARLRSPGGETATETARP